MRIAFVTYEYPPFQIGGAGVYAENITSELARLGHSVVVFTPKHSEGHSDPETENLRIVRIGAVTNLPFKSVRFWLHLPKHISHLERSQPFDAICFNGISYWFLRTKLSKAPHIMTVHHLAKDSIAMAKQSNDSVIRTIFGERNPILSTIERRALKSVDHVVAVSKTTRNQIMKVYGSDANDIDVIENGINLEEYVSFGGGRLREGLSIPNNRVILLYVGRVDDPRKGLDVLLKAYKIASIDFDSTLILVGRGSQNYARRLSMNLGIDRKVIFSGFVDRDELRDYYAICRLFVCPSILEGFGLTVLEAMAAGKPVIASRTGAIPEFIRDGESGFLVEPGDISSLADRMSRLMMDKELCLRFGAKNLEIVRTRFSWRDTAVAMENVIRSEISEN